MTDKYLLVGWEPGLTAEKVEAITGMTAHPTPLGVLVKEPPSYASIAQSMVEIDRALNPKRCQCRGILHSPDCPVGMCIT